MRTDVAVESTWTKLDITERQAESLRAAGKKLASLTRWWGAIDDDEPPADRTVIRCERSGPDSYRVKVSDAVGVVSVGDLNLLVRPKMSEDHFLYLLEASGEFPRIADQPAQIAAGRSLWELVARWYVNVLERLLRSDLRRDYRPQQDPLNYVRGRIHPLPTARSVLVGRIEVYCEYEEFDTDTALNRMLLAAARTVVIGHGLNDDLRRRARKLTLRMDGISALQPGDMHATVDRVTGHYSDSITLARSILRNQHRTLAVGAEAAWTFLIRTPEAVERGLVVRLNEQLSPIHNLRARKLLVAPGITVNPDIVIDNSRAVADVKYKLTSPQWRRSDLYQVVAFAEAFRATDAAIIDFASTQNAAAVVKFGDITVRNLTWPTQPGVTPEQGAARLAAQVLDWLAEPTGQIGLPEG